MELTLGEFGYGVVLAENDQDAVDKFIADRNTTQLVILDIIMHGMSGKEAYNEIRRVKPDVKAGRGDFDEGVELIMKPARPMELLRKVREILDR